MLHVFCYNQPVDKRRKYIFRAPFRAQYSYDDREKLEECQFRENKNISCLTLA